MPDIVNDKTSQKKTAATTSVVATEIVTEIFQTVKKFSNSAHATDFNLTPPKVLRKLKHTCCAKDGFQSMTSYADHKVWQDVYHVPCGNLILYVKFTQNVISEFTLLSFKEK